MINNNVPLGQDFSCCKPHVVLLTGNHLCHNPRVIKEALALTRAGMKVTVLGVWLDNGLKERDQKMLTAVGFGFLPVLDLTALNYRTALQKMICRVRTRLGALAYRFLVVPNCWQLGYAVDMMRSAAMKVDADFYIAHSEAGMQVAVDLLRRGARVGVDMEDWYSEDLLPEARKTRPVSLLKALESELLYFAVHATSTSNALCGALAKAYNCPLPRTVYNVFPWADRKMIDGMHRDRQDSKLPSIHWYSQTIGYGRGLEDLFSALPYLKKPVELHLRGKPVAGFDDWLSEQVPAGWRKRVFIHPLVPNDELLSRIAEHDIGFAGEMKYSLSRDLTITNKILHYLLAGLAVVASDTEGQIEVAGKAVDAVTLYPAGDSQKLASILNELLSSPELLNHAKIAAIKAAKQTFCWERQEKKIVESVRAALGQISL